MEEYILEENIRDVFDTLGCLPRELHLEVDKSIQPVQHMLRKLRVVIKEGIARKLTN